MIRAGRATHARWLMHLPIKRPIQCTNIQAGAESKSWLATLFVVIVVQIDCLVSANPSYLN
jgi:hypothetical protein